MRKIKKLIIIGMTILVAIIVGLLFLVRNCSSKKEDITIDKTQVHLYVGEQFTLTLSGTEKKVSWKSKDESVATVDQKGMITAIKEGTTKVSGFVQQKEFTCDVVVEEPYLNSSKLTLGNKQSFQLEMTGVAVKEWKCEDTSIATVDGNGNIVALKDGTTKVLCVTEHGQTYECELTVDSAHVHQYVSKITKEATCSECGITTYSCECGSSYTENIEKSSHEYEVTETVKSTCEKTGYKTFQCKKCNHVYKETLEKTKHDYKILKTINATETKDGYKEYECKNCGNTYKETIVKTSHTHNYKLVKTEKATCKKEGYQEYKCEKCTDSYKKTLSKLEHNYTLTASTESTCSTSGQEVYTCTNCKDSYTKTLSLDTSKHNYTQTSSDLMYKYFSCQCGKSYKEYNDQEYTIDLGNGKTKTVVGHYDLEMANELLNLINNKRNSIGRDSLTMAPLNSNLSKGAQIRGRELCVKMSHTRPNGESCLDLYIDIMGENITVGYSAQEMFDDFCNSPEHALAQISNKYTTISIMIFGTKQRNNTYCFGCVELFTHFIY